MSAKALGAGEGWVWKELTTVEPDSEIKLVRVSESTFRARFFMRNWGFGLVSLLVYGIPTFDSESFELEFNGSAWDTSGSRFVQIPLHSRPVPQTTNSRRGATTHKWVLLRESAGFCLTAECPPCSSS